MDAIFLLYEEENEKYLKPESYEPRMLRSVEMGWFLTDKYYQESDEAPFYATAFMLDLQKEQLTPSKLAIYSA